MLCLSIIIPMYNVAPYVEKCIRSLQNQDIPKQDYEIICINDGSPDNCREIVIKLQQEFSNIVFIEQENQGVSRARNNGIDKASGKYLLFIDPDDYVDVNSFARILKTAEDYRAQVSFLGYTVLNENGSIRKAVLNEQEKDAVYLGIKAYSLARVDGSADPDRMWAVLLETEFMNRNNLRYLPELPYLEDGELIARIMCLAQRCIFDGHLFLKRTTRPGSATNSKLFYSQRATGGFIRAAAHLRDFKDNVQLDKAQREFMNQPICKFTLTALIPYCSLFTLREFKQNFNLLKKNKLGICDLRKCNNAYSLEGSLYNLSPYLFLIHRMMGFPLLRIGRALKLLQI